METIQLLPSEYNATIYTPISSITFYTTTTASHASTKAYLQERVNAIVQANPWLSGRLRSGWFGANLTLEFNPNGRPLAVEEAHLPELSPQLEFAKLVTLCSPFDVVASTAVLHSDVALFRVTWITISDTQGALYFSLSHGLGDGYTYYRLYGMLSAKTTVQALTPTRILDFDERLDAAVQGGNDSSSLVTSVSFAFNMVKTMALSPGPPRFTMHTFNPEWIAEEKAKYKEESPVGYVSTNDVLTSWALRTTGCDVGFMAINCRGRVDGVDRQHAGNYQFVLGYQPQDYSSPGLIRESITTNRYRRARSGSFPAMWTTSTAIITSWVTLYEAAELPGWAMVEHLPAVCGNTPLTALVVFFQRTPTSIGVTFASRMDLKLDNDRAVAPRAAWH
ncbi:hypothetical protein LEN26_000573 [Aphanomyces euteiches]|nr:hypothetical protein AeMF1_003516 [Aphanomyces euteiches]KAH9163264.1 hypothetical protein LEN26_000573 [Aphanomyces euteiches]